MKGYLILEWTGKWRPSGEFAYLGSEARQLFNSREAAQRLIDRKIEYNVRLWQENEVMDQAGAELEGRIARSRHTIVEVELPDPPEEITT